MFPKLKDGVSVRYRPRGDVYEVHFLVGVTGVIYPFTLNREALDCLKCFDGTNSTSRIASNCGVDVKDVNSLISVLRENGLLEPMPCRKNELESCGRRYKTQLNFFSAFENDHLSRGDMQDRLINSSVSVVGLGGIGSWVLQSLVLGGVQKFILIDPDCVEISNLNRQCLFSFADLGRSKVLAAADRAKALNPHISVSVFPEKITTQDECVRFFHDSDLIINCADEPSTDSVNRIISEAGYQLNTPHILCGGYDGHLGFIGPTVIPGVSGCWSCYEHSIDSQASRLGFHQLLVTSSQIQGGNLGAISAIVGNFQALEGLKILSGFSMPRMINHSAEIDFLDLSVSLRRFRRRKNCPLCGC